MRLRNGSHQSLVPGRLSRSIRWRAVGKHLSSRPLIWSCICLSSSLLDSAETDSLELSKMRARAASLITPRPINSRTRPSQRLRARSVLGTVNLIGSGRDTAHEGRSHEGLCPSGHAGDRGPGLEGLGSGGSILAGRAESAAEVEQVVDLIVGREEALGLAS